MPKKFIGSRVEEKLYKEIERIATEDERSISFIVQSFLKQGVKHRQAKASRVL